MKTQKNFRSKVNKMLILELINFKIYKTKTKNQKLNNTFFLNQTLYNFKKILQVIFQYHFNRQKILTVGENLLLTNNKSFYLYKKTNHLFIPKEAWIHGLLSNKKKMEKFLKKKNPLLKSVKKPRLLISYIYSDLLDSERYQRRITDVTLSNSPKNFCYKKNLNYFILGNFNTIKKKKLFNIFSKFIEKILKTPKKDFSCFLDISSGLKKRKFYKKKWKKSYLLKSFVEKKQHNKVKKYFKKPFNKKH